MQIKVANLKKTFHDGERELAIIEDLSFAFESGVSSAIIGRSGIGKSTLLYLLGGLERPSSGTVLYEDTDLQKLDEPGLAGFRGRHIGFIFQTHQLLAEFNALENVAMPLFIANVEPKEALLRAEEVLLRVGLKERMTHSPGQLSGGEQQRVAIARAIVAQPAVLLADEPTGNLDFRTARQIQDLLMEMQQELRSTMIVVTHNQEFAQSAARSFEMQPGGFLAPVQTER